VKNQICTNIKEKLMHPVQFVFTVGKKNKYKVNISCRRSSCINSILLL